MALWNWLNCNSAALQSIAMLLGAVLTVVTIIVLMITWRAIRRQAEASESQAQAARALTEAATKQTNVMQEAATSAQKQCDLLSGQIEQNTSPLIVVEPDDRSDWKNAKLINRGPGVAFGVFYWRGGLEMRNEGEFEIKTVEPSTLAPGAWIYVPVPPAWEVFTVRYRGSDREERWTIKYRDSAKPQEHVAKKGLKEYYL